eukprot:6239682-Amphidinium_carterae.3
MHPKTFVGFQNFAHVLPTWKPGLEVKPACFRMLALHLDAGIVACWPEACATKHSRFKQSHYHWGENYYNIRNYEQQWFDVTRTTRNCALSEPEVGKKWDCKRFSDSLQGSVKSVRKIL